MAALSGHTRSAHVSRALPDNPALTNLEPARLPPPPLFFVPRHPGSRAQTGSVPIFFRRLGLFVALGAMLAGCAANRPPLHEPPHRPPSRKALVWQQGAWRWDHGSYLWVPGHYTERRISRRWIPAHWHDGRWVAGAWV